MWGKLKSFARVHMHKSRGDSREMVNNLHNNISVNKEYLEALRTRSYTEIWSKVQEELRRTEEEHLSLSYLHLSEFLLEPRQETVIDLIEERVIAHGSGLDLHQLVYDYFDSSTEACKICGFLLQSIEKTRLNHKIIQRVIKITQRDGDYTEEQCSSILSDLYSFTQMENPLSDSNPAEKFRQIHDIYGSMLKRLRSRRRKIKRKVKLITFCKKASGVGLVLACTALIVVAMILAAHGFFGVLAGPVLINGSWGLCKDRLESIKLFRTSVLKRLDAQLDAAARGAYILNRDFDTMGRLVTRLHDEIEHYEGMISICLRNKERHLLREVVKELEANEASFLEQLEELEEHVYLCFLTINKARRLVVQEISMQQHP